MAEIIITSALPYANGPIHIGHLVEYIQTDIYVRYLKLEGKKAVYCCADDTHGTAIEINAKKVGKAPEEFIQHWHEAHQESFKRYGIVFDSYYSTNSSENRQLSERIYAKLKDGGHIYEKEIEQLYDEQEGRFLPDRYVKGACPKCGASDQYGDVCEKCNATYKPADLVNPYSIISNTTPVLKKSTHLFFKLSAFSDFLEEWLQNERLQPEIRNQIQEWIKKGLDDWCISRDAPYFGFKIPGTEKYFYVWLDAPVGYISSLAHLLGDIDAAERAWNQAEVQHFIGKDIIYFHLLFWPAVLHAAGWKTPDNLIVHGFLTVDGEKMSKSRGTFLTAEEFAEQVPDTEFLRYYYAANLTHAMTDLDLNLHDFTQRVNTELVGNLANFIYRTLSFIQKNYNGKLSGMPDDERARTTIAKARELAVTARAAYAKYEFRKAMQAVLHLSQIGNQYFQEAAPWKDPAGSQAVLTLCAMLVRDASLLLEPVMPRFCATVRAQLNVKARIGDLGKPLEGHTIGTPAIIWRRMEPLQFGTPPATKNEGGEQERVGGEDDEPAFIVAEITNVEKHPKADKLYIETLNDGSDEPRTIVSGLVPYYKAEELVGKRIILVENLKPAKLRGIESQGMLLAVENAENVTLLEAPDAAPGTTIEIAGTPAGRREITIDEFFAHKMEARDGTVTWDGKRLMIGGKPLASAVDGKVS